MSYLNSHVSELEGAGSGFILEPENSEIHPDDEWSKHKAVQDVDLDGYKVTNLANPTQNNDAVSLDYFNNNKSNVKYITSENFISIPNDGGDAHIKSVTGLPLSKYKCDIEAVIVSEFSETDNDYIYFEHRCSGGGIESQDPVRYMRLHKDSDTSPINLNRIKVGTLNFYTYHYSYSCITDETDSIDFKTVLTDNGALANGTISLAVNSYQRIMIQPITTI